MSGRRIVTVVLEVGPDKPDEASVADAIRWSLEGAGCAAIDPATERIVSITIVDENLAEVPR